MIMKKCDRCGMMFDTKRIEDLSRLDLANALDVVWYPFDDNGEFDKRLKTFDLCKRCMKDFIKWMNSFNDERETSKNERPDGL